MNSPSSALPSEAFHRTESALSQKFINALADQFPDIIGAVVSTADGFEIAARLPPSLSPATLSAMTSSQLALGEAMSTETGSGRCVNVVIEADRGKLVMVEIPNRGRKRLLTVLCNETISLGSLLWPVRRCAAQIGEHLDAAFE
jgi:uncharacterized protein